jgi:hypothetical protein
MKLSQCIGAVVALSLCGQLNTASLDEQCLGLGLSHDLCLERAFAEDYASLGPDVSYNSDYYKFSYTLGYGARFPNAFMFKHPRYNAEMCDMASGNNCDSITCTRYTSPLDQKPHFYVYSDSTPASCSYYASAPPEVRVFEELMGTSLQLVRQTSGTSIMIRWNASTPTTNRDVDFYIAQ